MPSKIVNLAVIGVLVATLMLAMFQVGRRSLTEHEIELQYHRIWDLRPPGEAANYPYSSIAPTDLYLDLMKLSLTDLLYQTHAEGQPPTEALYNRVLTQLSLKRLDNVQFCMEDVLARGVPGDFIEAGVWRGGATILMRAVLKAHQVDNRIVWAADSFEGFPVADLARFPEDRINAGSEQNMAVSKETVEQNFRRYGLLDSQVRFLKGWFKDTLPGPVGQLAVLRADADMYESTMQILVSLYPHVSPGGYIIIDDYGYNPACAKAIEDFRRNNGITEQIKRIDSTGIYWQKS